MGAGLSIIGGKGMVEFITNMIAKMIQPLSSKVHFELDGEFKDGKCRDLIIMLAMIDGYLTDSETLNEDQYGKLKAIADTSTDGFIREVMPEVIERTFRKQVPITKMQAFANKHYGSKYSAKRLLSFYRCK